MVKRIVVGAHYGLRDWLMQRVTAAVMAVYTLLLAVIVLSASPVGYVEWRALFAAPWLRYASLLFLISLCLHAWVGVRDILMDYVHPPGVRLLLEVLAILALAVYGAWSVEILWSI